MIKFYIEFVSVEKLYLKNFIEFIKLYFNFFVNVQVSIIF